MTRVKPHGITDPAQTVPKLVKWIFVWSGAGVVVLFLMWQGFNLALHARQQANLPPPPNGNVPAVYTTTVVTPPPASHMPTTIDSCDGPQPTLTIDEAQVILPERCHVVVEVLSGTLTLQGRDGSKVYLTPDGATGPIPKGFKAGRIWSEGGATINATLTPSPSS